MESADDAREIVRRQMTLLLERGLQRLRADEPVSIVLGLVDEGLVHGCSYSTKCTIEQAFAALGATQIAVIEFGDQLSASCGGRPTGLKLHSVK